MISFFESYSLRQSVSSAVHTVHVLAQLTKVDVELFDGQFENRYIFSSILIQCCIYITSTKHVVQLHIQLTLVISTSLISNNRLSRSENLIPA